MKRRTFLKCCSGAGVASFAQSPPAANQKEVLPIEEFQPRSMLHGAETKVMRAAYPVIDFHTPIIHAGGLEGPGELRFAANAEECLAVMDRKNIRTMVNLTGGYGANLQKAVDAFASRASRPLPELHETCLE